MTDETKKCPVCGAISFKDMDVCFGCLHRFEEDEASEAVGAERDFGRIEMEEESNNKEERIDSSGKDARLDPKAAESRYSADVIKLLAYDGSDLEMLISFQPVKAHIAVRRK